MKNPVYLLIPLFIIASVIYGCNKTALVTDFINIKAGPVFNFPVKQISTSQIDSANRVMLTRSRFDHKIDIGLSGGVSLHYKRFMFEATYLKGLTNHKTVSDSLSYQSRIKPSFQFVIGFRIGKGKK